MADTAEKGSEGMWVPEDSFATRLLVVRRTRGLSQAEAARRCDLDDGSWSNWENGTMPRDFLSVVTKISNGLGVDPRYLMPGLSTGYDPDSGEQLAFPFPSDGLVHLPLPVTGRKWHAPLVLSA